MSSSSFVSVTRECSIFSSRSQDFEAKVMSLSNSSSGVRLVQSTPFILKGLIGDVVSSPERVNDNFYVTTKEVVNKVKESWSL